MDDFLVVEHEGILSALRVSPSDLARIQATRELQIQVGNKVFEPERWNVIPAATAHAALYHVLQEKARRQNNVVHWSPPRL